MELSWLDISLFVLFFLIVVGVSMYKSRKEKTGEDFFLASRGLIWPLIGLSLIAANISTEHFVGMSGQGASDVGLAVASYEWMAAITLVFVAFFFIIIVMGIMTIVRPLEKPVTLPVRKDFDMKPTKSVLWLGIAVILITISLYIYFW